MPYCPKTNTLFIHIPKTAGTSIEKSLGIYGKNNTEGGRSICNDLLFGRGMQHYTAAEAVAHLVLHCFPHDPERSFAVLRDPIKRFISHYRWTPQGEKSGRDLERFFAEVFLPSLGDKGVEARHRWPQPYFILGMDNKVAVRYLINFANLELGFQRVADRLGLSVGELPHLKRANGSVNGDRVPTMPDYIQCFLEDFYRGDTELVEAFGSREAFIENDMLPAAAFDNLGQLSQRIRDSAISAALKTIQAGMPSQPFAYGLGSLYYKSGNVKAARLHLLQVQNDKLAGQVQRFRQLLWWFAFTRVHRIPTIDRKMRRFIRLR